MREAGWELGALPGAVVGTLALCAGFWTEALAATLFFRVDARRLCCWCFPCCCNPPKKRIMQKKNGAGSLGAFAGTNGLVKVDVELDEEELGLLASATQEEQERVGAVADGELGLGPGVRVKEEWRRKKKLDSYS